MWEAAPASGIGGRDEQEDRVGCFPASSGAAWLLALADGMGGHGNGDLAAEIVIDVARSMWEAYGGRIAEPQGFLATLCFTVHREINDQGRARGVSPHSTGVFLLLGEHGAHWCHVGDSRLYQFQNGTLVRRTRDHSVVQMLVELGQIDPAEMATHPDQNKLFRSLGGETDPEPSFGAAAVTARDGFVLCSDGLWETVSEPEMAAALQAADLPAAAAALVATATRRAGPHGDNVAVILARPVRAKEPKPAGAGSTGAGATSGAPVTAGTGARSDWKPHRIALAAGTVLGVMAAALLARGPVEVALDTWLRHTKAGPSIADRLGTSGEDAAKGPAEAETAGTGAAAPAIESAPMTASPAAVPDATPAGDNPPPESPMTAPETEPDHQPAGSSETPQAAAAPGSDERPDSQGAVKPATPPMQARNIPPPRPLPPERRMQPAAAAGADETAAAAAGADETAAARAAGKGAAAPAAGESATAPAAGEGAAAPSQDQPPPLEPKPEQGEPSP